MHSFDRGRFFSAFFFPTGFRAPLGVRLLGWCSSHTNIEIQNAPFLLFLHIYSSSWFPFGYDCAAPPCLVTASSFATRTVTFRLWCLGPTLSRNSHVMKHVAHWLGCFGPPCCVCCPPRTKPQSKTCWSGARHSQSQLAVNNNISLLAVCVIMAFVKYLTFQSIVFVTLCDIFFATISRHL